MVCASNSRQCFLQGDGTAREPNHAKRDCLGSGPDRTIGHFDARAPTNGAATPRKKMPWSQCGYTTSVRLREPPSAKVGCASSIPIWRLTPAAQRRSSPLRCRLEAEHCARARFYGRMIFSENRIAPSDQVRGQAFSGSRPTYSSSSKNSLLFLVLRSLSSRKSMASMVPIGLRMRRSTYIFLS